MCNSFTYVFSFSLSAFLFIWFLCWAVFLELCRTLVRIFCTGLWNDASRHPSIFFFLIKVSSMNHLSPRIGSSVTKNPMFTLCCGMNGQICWTQKNGFQGFPCLWSSVFSSLTQLQFDFLCVKWSETLKMSFSFFLCRKIIVSWRGTMWFGKVHFHLVAGWIVSNMPAIHIAYIRNYKSVLKTFWIKKLSRHVHPTVYTSDSEQKDTEVCNIDKSSTP